jgi:lambda repressor-like predicted transcriptional regulator
MKTLNHNEFLINRKKMLYDRRYSMSRLAIDLGVTPQAVIAAVHAKTKSYTMHKKIVDKLGVSLVEFWPELYGEDIVHQDVDHLTVRDS